MKLMPVSAQTSSSCHPCRGRDSSLNDSARNKMFDLGKRFLIALTAAERKYQYDYSDLHGTFLTGTLDDEARHALS